MLSQQNCLPWSEQFAEAAQGPGMSSLPTGMTSLSQIRPPGPMWSSHNPGTFGNVWENLAAF